MIRGMKGVIAPVLRIVRSTTAKAKLRIISVKPKTRYNHLFKASATPWRDVSSSVPCMVNFEVKYLCKKGGFAGDISTPRVKSFYVGTELPLTLWKCSASSCLVFKCSENKPFTKRWGVSLIERERRCRNKTVSSSTPKIFC